ncbi:MAG: hypothetical protein L0215_01170 [Gemmataceae bacterium]|nr:hypothetical protein [Gemmataceae bacterium]
MAPISSHCGNSRPRRPALVRVLLSAVCGAALVLAAAGCQSQGNVSGKVTYKSKPVVFGTILIQGSDGNARQGNIATDGSFSVRGLAVGQARVAVNSPDPKGITLLPNRNPNYKQDPYPDVPGWFALPNRFEDVSTSGLTYQINGGNNTINIELE